MSKWLELAQQIDRLAQERGILEIDLMRRALETYETFQKIGNAAQREYIYVTILSCAQQNISFASHYDQICSRSQDERRVLDEAKNWRRSQIAGQPYEIGDLARAVDALLVNDPELSEHDRNHLNKLQANNRICVELERAVVAAAVSQRQLGLVPRSTSAVDPGAFEMATIHLHHAIDSLITQRGKLSSGEADAKI